MLLEELNNIDALNRTQRHIVEGVNHLLQPVDEAILDMYHTGSLVRYDNGRFYLVMTIHSRAPHSLAVELVAYPASAILSLDGWHQQYPFTTGDPHADTDRLFTTLAALFSGRIKVAVEESSGHAFHWTRYDQVGDHWQLHSTVKSSIYNYFGHKQTVEKYCRLYGDGKEELEVRS